VCAKGIKKELNILDEADFVRDVLNTYLDTPRFQVSGSLALQAVSRETLSRPILGVETLRVDLMLVFSISFSILPLMSILVRALYVARSLGNYGFFCATYSASLYFFLISTPLSVGVIQAQFDGS
jgi:hypothetical protein